MAGPHRLPDALRQVGALARRDLSLATRQQRTG
jgi:hypothetical protein